MDVEGQPPAAASKPKKGKGKGRASTRAATAAAAAAAAAAAVEGGDNDSDVDMSGGDETAGKSTDTPAASAAAAHSSSSSSDELDMIGVLDCIPREVVYTAWPGFVAPPVGPEPEANEGDGGGAGTKSSSDSSAQPAVAVVEELPPLLKAFSSLLRSLATTDWLAAALTMLTRWAHSRSAQSSPGQQASSRWGATLITGSGRSVLERLMRLHRYVLMEVRRG